MLTKTRRSGKVGAMTYALLIKTLMTKPCCTRADLVEVTGLHPLTVGDYVRSLREAGVIHIAAWATDSMGRRRVEVYGWGQGDDAVRAPLTMTERRRNYRMRKQLESIENTPRRSAGSGAPSYAGVFQVCEKMCDECLFTKARIVSEDRQKKIIEECERDGTYFVCHKGSLAGNGQLCCRGFFDNVETTVTGLAKELGLVRYVPVPKVD